METLLGITVGLTVAIFILASRLHTARQRCIQARMDAEEADLRALSLSLHVNSQAVALRSYERVLSDLELRSGLQRSEVIVVPKMTSQIIFERM